MGSRHILLTRSFAFVWSGQLVAQIGDGVTKLALLWFVYAITGSPLKTTIIGMLQTIPPIVFGPLIGVLVDRLPKKPTLITIDLLRAVLIGVIPCWASADSFTVERLYLLVFLHAIATAVAGPALLATIPRIVGRDQYTAANALVQGTTSLGVIVGPALSGIGIATLSSQQVLCVNAVTYVFSAACFLPITLSPRPAPTEHRSPMSDLMEGFRFVLQPMILLVIATAALHSFGTAAFSTLFPVFGRKMLDLGPVEVGYLWSAFGIGLFLTSMALIRVVGWSLEQRIKAIAASAAMTGSALLALATSPTGLIAAIWMIVIGLGVGVFTPIAWGVLQELSPEALVGRVLTIYGTGAMTAAIAGMTAFGWATQDWGERPSVVGIGLVLLVTAVFAARFGGWIRTSASALRT